MCVEAGGPCSLVGGNEHIGRLARLERPDEQDVAGGEAVPLARGGDLGLRGQLGIDAGGHDADAIGIEAPAVRGLVGDRPGQADHAPGARGQAVRAGDPVEQHLVAREIFGAPVPGEILDGEHQGNAARGRERRNGGHPDDVGALRERAVDAREAGQAGGRVRQAPKATAVADHIWARRQLRPSVNRPAAYQHRELVLREPVRKRSYEATCVPSHSSRRRVGEGAAIDADPHRFAPAG